MRILLLIVCWKETIIIALSTSKKHRIHPSFTNPTHHATGVSIYAVCLIPTSFGSLNSVSGVQYFLPKCEGRITRAHEFFIPVGPAGWAKPNKPIFLVLLLLDLLLNKLITIGRFNEGHIQEGVLWSGIFLWQFYIIIWHFPIVQCENLIYGAGTFFSRILP